jgi:hypothetical protein
MPTAQARMTPARGLHATRSSIRSDNDMSSLRERRIACRLFLFRWHRAHTCHTLKVRTATSTDRWPGSQVRMTCAPCQGTCPRLGSRWALLPHAGLAGECALCAFLSCKSCLYSGYRPLQTRVAAFLALHTLRALSWDTVVRRGNRWRLLRRPSSWSIARFRTGHAQTG